MPFASYRWRMHPHHRRSPRRERLDRRPVGGGFFLTFPGRLAPPAALFIVVKPESTEEWACGHRQMVTTDGDHRRRCPTPLVGPVGDRLTAFVDGRREFRCLPSSVRTTGGRCQSNMPRGGRSNAASCALIVWSTRSSRSVARRSWSRRIRAVVEYCGLLPLLPFTGCTSATVVDPCAPSYLSAKHRSKTWTRVAGLRLPAPLPARLVCRPQRWASWARRGPVML
jgi:hypothetical protein